MRRYDYQKLFGEVMARVDGQPPAKAAFEKILSLHISAAKYKLPTSQEGIIDLKSREVISELERKIGVQHELALKGAVSPIDLYHVGFVQQAEAMYDCELDKRLGLLDKVIKAYIVHGRLNEYFGRKIAQGAKFVLRRKRFQRWPLLQGIANAIMYSFDYAAANTLTTDWVRISQYGEEKFPEMNPSEESKSDKK